ncbi:hypothetical protein [Caldalkalibacillus mannanilyticus]|uniref:hypothetical protein n=1 Tax=Caldalkalibacillus mannanilyticus TaxID=1418 RepID=UPI0004686AEE|nr:hypothetical protein [Caldalkalibacillus mannanilyticus]
MRRMLFFVLLILVITGCSAIETKWDYKGYIIGVVDREDFQAYQIMWDISEQDLKTKSAIELTEFNHGNLVYVLFEEKNSEQNGFKVGDKVLIQVEEELVRGMVTPKKIELDTRDEQ